jgi:hypothetical protein
MKRDKKIGADKLAQFILLNFPDVVSELHKERMDHLYVDLNSIIHQSVSTVFSKLKKKSENAPSQKPQEINVELEIQNLKVPVPNLKDLQNISKLISDQITAIYKNYSPKKSFYISLVGIYNF